MSYLEFLNYRLGEYTFENHFFYDPVAHKSENLNATKIHEGIHYYLTQNSTSGIVISLLLQLAKKCGNKVPFAQIAKILIRRTRKTQEACATFAECIFVKENHGLLACKKMLEKLNREYYGYVQDLIPLLEYSSADALKLVLEVGIRALDIDFLILPKGYIRVPKYLDRFTQQQRNAFDSDRRFKLIIDCMVSKLKARGSINSISLDDLCNSLAIPNNRETNLPGKIIDWLKAELSHDVRPDIIESFICERKDGEQPSVSYFAAGLPLTMNKRFTKKRGIPDLWTPGVLFLFYFTPNFTVAWMDFINEISYSFPANVDKVIRLYRSVNKAFILTREDYEELQDLLKEHFDTSHLFIYNNQLYYMALDFIEAHISPRREVFMMEYDSKAYYLFIKLSDNYVFIQPIEQQDIPQILSNYTYINGEHDDINKAFYNGNLSWTMYDDIIYALLQMKMYDKIGEIRPKFMVLK